MPEPEIDKLERTIAALEAQRATLGDDVVSTATGPLRRRVAELRGGEAPQRKHVTVLFGDVSGFTAMSELVDPEIVRARMNALWSRIDRVIEDHGGTIDKHIGDAVMALFGAPVALEDHALCAVRAGLAMQEELRRFASAAEEVPLGMRIGIHSGVVALGSVGGRREYTAIGDTVNTASRLEHAAPVGGVLISGATHELVARQVEARPLRPLALKGKREPVAVFQLDGVADTVHDIDQIRPTHGREAELEQLDALYQEMVRTGDSRAALITGEAGIGKSHLIGRFVSQLSRSADATIVWVGAASSDRRFVAHGVVSEVLAALCGLRPDDTPTERTEKLVRGISPYVAPEGARTDAAVLATVLDGALPDLPLPASVSGSVSMTRQALFETARRYLAGVCSDLPLVLVLEDLHQADGASMELLVHLLEHKVAGAPLFALLSGRTALTERFPVLGQAARPALHLALGPLPDAAAEAMLDASGASLPPAQRGRILRAAGGNPYFLSELLEAMPRTGYADDLAVPPTLIGLLQARLDALPARERRVLQRASVVGNPFWRAALADDPAEVAATLASLERRGLIRREREEALAGSPAFVFATALFHEATYSTVLLRERASWASQAAAWLQSVTADRAGPWAGRIAKHLERADQPVEAARWLIRSGEWAISTGALATAARHLERVETLLEGRSEGRELYREALFQRGIVHDRRHEPHEVLATFGRFREASEQDGVEEKVARALVLEGVALNDLSRFEEMETRTASAAALATRRNERDVLAQALDLRAWARMAAGDVPGALASATEAVANAEEVGDPIVLGGALRTLASMRGAQGDTVGCEAVARQARALLEPSGDHFSHLAVCVDLGGVLRLRGALEEAEALTDQALAISERMQYTVGRLYCRYQLSEILVQQGRGEEAWAHAEAALSEAPDWWVPRAHLWAIRAEASLVEGDVARAGDEVLTALSQAKPASLDTACAFHVAARLAAMDAPVVVEGATMSVSDCLATARGMLPVAEACAGEPTNLRQVNAVRTQLLLEAELGEGDGSQLRGEAERVSQHYGLVRPR